MKKMPMHATFKPRCNECAFSLEDGASGGMICRRYPPTMFMMMAAPTIALSPNQQPQPMPASAYPPTQRNHWCGEWQRKSDGEA